MDKIKLNFLELQNQNFSFEIYRRGIYTTSDVPKGEKKYRLPLNENLEEWKSYFISIEPKDDYEKFECDQNTNNDLTKWFLFEAFKSHLIENGNKYHFRIDDNGKSPEILFLLQKYEQGEQVVSLSPYLLKTHGTFGFLVDFKFIMDEGYRFDKEVQRLSLSLDNRYRSNKNFYLDKLQIFRKFFSSTLVRLAEFSLGKTGNKLNMDLVEMPAFYLGKKEYIFSKGRTSYSQFMGVKNYGPYENVAEDIQFIFLFEDRFRSFANEIFLSLTGKQYPGTFGGMEQMFKIKLTKENVYRLPIQNYRQDTMAEVVEQVVKIENETSKKTIAIFIEDYVEGEGSSEPYYFFKYQFMLRDIPLQVLNYRKHGMKNALKWSASNIGLQIFAKLGGKPWVVKPANNNCLILGIGSSHKIDRETQEVQKYFAYTVCLDSSGLYKKLDILADDENEDEYLKKLENNIVKLLQSEEFKSYTSCVLHLPFKIRGKEIEALKKAIKRISEVKFLAVKINTKNKYFGFSSHNTHVPYESSYIQLSRNHFLVWFEGLNYGKEVVDKRISNPVDIQFLNFEEVKEDEYKRYLQDVLNLSGANWRGFNSKSMPISIYYSKIIAEYISEFKLRVGSGNLLRVNDKPWFL
jgi:hypothetical protein